jgi:hypothetical protein
LATLVRLQSCISRKMGCIVNDKVITERIKNKKKKKKKLKLIIFRNQKYYCNELVSSMTVIYDLPLTAGGSHTYHYNELVSPMTVIYDFPLTIGGSHTSSQQVDLTRVGSTCCEGEIIYDRHRRSFFYCNITDIITYTWTPLKN